MVALPTGTVTFLFTDIQGSTRLWEDHPDDAGAMIARHDAIFDDVVAANDGINVKPRGEGDSRFAVFSRASDGVHAILEFQRRMAAESWAHPLKVRAALNTGEADVRDGDYYGPPVNRCARIRGVAHGGQTLLSDATADLVADSLPEGATLRDLATHRLKDLSRPQRLYQLGHADLDDDFPALASLDALPTNLPAQLTSFVGREHELAEVRRLLGTTRLVTLTGAGGVGKTRLALQVAADLIEAYPRGVWFADLAPVSDPDLVPGVVARAIGMGASGEGATAELIADYCGSGMALLVFDNCEHLLAACAEIAEQLLTRCPSIRILATSREALGVPGEAAWRAPSLSLPKPGVEIEHSEAVRLFIDRARLADPGVEFQEPEDLEAMARICRRLDGIPLAIELAATRVSTMSAGEIATRLDDRFRLLVGGRRTVLERQQTLRAAIDWSHEPLDDTERTLFRRLSAFVGGFTLDGAEAVCGGDGVEGVEVVDVVRRLAEKSLLLVERAPTGTRYRMLETIRQYAREKLLDSGESPAIHAAHRNFYLDMATGAEIELLGPDQAAWFNLLRDEADNLRAALEWTEGDPEGADAFLRFAIALWRFWYVHDIHEGRRWFDAALAAAPNAPPVLRARARVRSAELAFADLDVADSIARADAEEAVRLAREIGDQSVEAWGLTLFGWHLHAEDPQRAKLMLAEAIEIARSASDEWVEAHVLAAQGGIAYTVDDLEAARRIWGECRAICERIGDRWTLARLIFTSASMMRALGDAIAAARAYDEAASERRALGDESGAAAVNILATLSAIPEQGPDPFLRSIDDALATARRLGNARLASGTLAVKATWALSVDDLPLARSLLDESEAAGGEHAFLSFRDLAGARICRLEGRLDHARRYAENWLAAAYEMHTPLGVAEGLDAIAPILAAEGSPEFAARLFGVAEAQRRHRGCVVVPERNPTYPADVAEVRSALGDDAFQRAWAAGAGMSLDRAVAAAVGCFTRATTPLDIRRPSITPRV